VATPEEEIAVTMSFPSLTDAFAVAMEQWGAQHCVFISETFFKNGNSVVKTQ
jgi:hypothetical protein